MIFFLVKLVFEFVKIKKFIINFKLKIEFSIEKINFPFIIIIF